MSRFHSRIQLDATNIEDEGRSRLAADADALSRQLWDIMTYVGDYRVEVMNALTGDLLDACVPRRQPLHPAYKTLTQLAIKEFVDAEEQRRTQQAILGIQEPTARP